MTRPDDIDTAALRDLLAKATPGPWEANGTAISKGGWTLAHLFLIPDSSGSTERSDVALIVAAINALPALLDVVDNATTQKQRADHLSGKVSRVEALADLWFEKGGPSPRWQNDLRRALGGDQHQEDHE